VEKSVNSACDAEFCATTIKRACRNVKQVALKLSLFAYCVLSAYLERLYAFDMLELVEVAETDGVAEQFFEWVHEA